MKKLLLFFQLFIIFREQKSFSQTLYADSGKQIKITIFCKEIPNDSCRMKPKDRKLSKKSHRSIVMGQDAPAFIYPTSEDIYRWVREWQKEFKGVSIQY